MSTLFPYPRNARDCTDKSGACRVGSAWLNYYVKSNRRLGRGPDFAAVLGEKSRMTGGCERNACISARFGTEAELALAVQRPHETEIRHTRQGISSTDKDVIATLDEHTAAGGFSCSHLLPGAGSLNPTDRQVVEGRQSEGDIALADGRNGEGLDSGVVSVKLPGAKWIAKAARWALVIRRLPRECRLIGLLTLLRQLRGGGFRATFSIKEVFPPHGANQCGWKERIRWQATGPKKGIRQGLPAL